MITASSSRVNLYFAVCSVNIGAFAVGNGVTWTSPTLPKLEAPDSWIHLHSDEDSWIGSLVCIGAGIGPFPGGYLADKFGRKVTCYIAVTIDILSWLLLLFANSVYEIYIARITAGIAVGLVYAAVPLYIAEIAEDSIRSALGSLMSLCVCSGYLLPYCIGPYVSYNVLIYCSLIMPVTFLLLFPFASESPYYLLQKGRKEVALASLKWLRKGKTVDDVEKELHTMQLFVEDQMRNAGKLSDLVATPSNRYALMLSLCAVSFQQFSGVNAILFYSETIFDITGTSISSSISTIIVGSMLAVAGAFAPPFARYFGIKYMFIVSAFGMALFQVILGFYFYALSFGPVNSFNWLPVTCLACFIYVYSIVNIGAFAVGHGLTWTSPTLPKLQAPDSWLHLHGDEVSWIGSLASLGAAVGPFPGGYLANKFGRKSACYIAIAIEVLSWILLLFATSVYGIYVARVTAGIAAGLIYAVVPLYVGEIAEDSVRGALGAVLSLSTCSGYLMVYCVGPYVSYNVLIYCSLIAPIIFVILFNFVPESPYYLLEKGKEVEALASLTWLRKGMTPVDVGNELHMMQMTVEDQMRNAGKLVDLVATPSNRYALMLSSGAMIFQQFSGINVVLFYSQTIFDMTGASISSSISTIIIGTILVVAGASAPPFAKHFGIKHMFIASAFGMAIFQGILGFYFYLVSFGPADSLKWLPITSLICYICVYSVGFGPLPWALVAETFPSNIKPMASAVSASLNWGFSFILTRYFKNVSDLLGIYSAFWLFSSFCIVAFFYSYYLVPDTRGKSLQEIQNILNKRTNI